MHFKITCFQYIILLANCQYLLLCWSLKILLLISKVVVTNVMFLQEYLDCQNQKPLPVPLSLEHTLLPAVLPSR